MKLDRRRKYYLVLDCETATLPCAADYAEEQKKKICIAKPLIYDLGWTIVDKKGKIYAKRNFIISEVFSVPDIFNTAYYAEKRPLYLEQIEGGKLTVKPWREAVQILEEDMQSVAAVGAYNAMFDFKKAIPFTELYINMLYSAEYFDWYNMQKGICKEIAEGKRRESNSTFNPNEFLFHGKHYPLFDIWGIACKYILNCEKYRDFCKENRFLTASGKYFQSNAQVCYRFITKQDDFIEAHTALNDAEIESEIFAASVKKAKNQVEIGLIYFPFKLIGKIE